MLKRLAIAAAFVACTATPAMAATSYSPCFAFAQPTPGDPAVANTWGTILNTNFGLVDSALGGTLTLSVAGAANVTLTQASGAADQARNQHFIFTGTLTGNIKVLFPPAPRCGSFSVFNNTNGAFTLSAGVSNGSGDSLGTVVSVPQGGTLLLVSDGTNVSAAVDHTGVGGAGAGANSDITSLSGLTTPLTVAQGGSGVATLTNHGVVVGQGTAAVHITAAGSTGQVLTSNGASSDPTFQAIPGGGTLAVSGGGTGATTLTNHGVMLGQGTSAVHVTATGTAGQVLTSNGAGSDPTWQAGGGGGGGVKEALINLGTPNAGAALSASHGLTSPVGVSGYIKCTNAGGCDGGYSNGDFAAIINVGAVGGTVWYNATTVGMSLSSSAMNVTPKAGGIAVPITPASWTAFALVLGI